MYVDLSHRLLLSALHFYSFASLFLSLLLAVQAYAISPALSRSHFDTQPICLQYSTKSTRRELYMYISGLNPCEYISANPVHIWITTPPVLSLSHITDLFPLCSALFYPTLGLSLFFSLPVCPLPTCLLALLHRSAWCRDTRSMLSLQANFISQG